MSLSKLQDTINNKFLYTSNGQSENEILRSISFIMSKRIKCLRISETESYLLKTTNAIEKQKN